MCSLLNIQYHYSSLPTPQHPSTFFQLYYIKIERKTFKKGIDFESARSRRSNEGIELRKHRRLEELQKRRRAFQSASSGESNTYSISITGGSNTDSTGTESTEKLALYLSHLNLNISDSVFQLITRTSTSSESLSSPLSPYSGTGTTNRLDAQSNVHLKDMVAQSGIIPHLVQAMRSDNLELRVQSALCIGNIAGEKVELRDLVLQSENVISSM